MNDNDDLTTRPVARRSTTTPHAMDGTSLGLADVQGRARSIRRRRTATAVVGAAAAVALIVPTAALATHTGGRSNEPLPATNSVSPTPDRDRRRRDQHRLRACSTCPTCRPGPRRGWTTSTSATAGSTSPTAASSTCAPSTCPDQFVEMADGARVWQTADDNGRSYVEIQDADGTFHDPVRSGWGLSVNAAPQHRRVADPGRPGHHLGGLGQRAEAARRPGPRHRPAPGPGHGQRRGAPGAAPARTAPASSCTVIANVQGGTRQPWEVSDVRDRSRCSTAATSTSTTSARPA